MRARRAGWVLLCGVPLAVVLACPSHARRTTRDAVTLPLGLSALLPVPEDNPLAPAIAALGRDLFFDPRLSRDHTLTCATCHQPERAFSDGRTRAVGQGGAIGRRNTPSLVNVAYRGALFWDGRAASLEQQALLPIENPIEMGASLAAVVARLRGDAALVARFGAAFGSPGVDADRLARALAAFERTLVIGDTPFDRHTWGARDAALQAAARRGRALFAGKARCAFCHAGLQFADDRFHNTGVGSGEQPLDVGRFEVTGRDEDRGRFATPGLRQLLHTAPYMHDGSLLSLADVVEFYDRGGNPNPQLDHLIRPLGLTSDEKRDLVGFLESLSSAAAPRVP